MVVRILRRNTKGILKRFGIFPVSGSAARIVVSFAAGVFVTLLATSQDSGGGGFRNPPVGPAGRRDYDPRRRQHWDQHPGQYDQADGLSKRKGILGRLLGRNWDDDDHDSEDHDIGAGPAGYKREHVHEGDDSVALELKKQVRVLCWIMTQPSNHKKMAVHVKATWGKRCNILLFMSTADDPELPTVNLNITEGRNELWNKTREAFRYAYEHYLDQADWFLKADDDTYVVVENLRYFLRDHSPDEAVWFGCNFKKFSPQGYMSGGAGYVLSKEAVRRFVEVAIPDEKVCRSDGHGAEDAEMGGCLGNVNVTAGDSRDDEKRWRFFPFGPDYFLGPGEMSKDFWFWDYIKYPYFHGPDCCSDTAISFHYISPGQMYVLDYLIYHLQPYGRGWRTKPPGPELARYIEALAANDTSTESAKGSTAVAVADEEEERPAAAASSADEQRRAEVPADDGGNNKPADDEARVAALAVPADGNSTKAEDE